MRTGVGQEPHLPRAEATSETHLVIAGESGPHAPFRVPLASERGSRHGMGQSGPSRCTRAAASLPAGDQMLWPLPTRYSSGVGSSQMGAWAVGSRRHLHLCRPGSLPAVRQPC